MTQKVILDLDDLVKIADSIREQIDSENKMRFKEMPDLISGIAADGTLYLLEDEEGNQAYATMIGDTPVDITATANDIRIGTTAVTDEGVTVGEKVIPAYITTEGYKVIPVKSSFELKGFYYYDYTKLQVLICAFNSSIANSVATEKVSINNKVYNVNSTEILSEVTINDETKSINLNIINNGETPYIMRYFTYKEIE